jgi:predicted DNA-binding transcriptional regulator YafY
MGSRTSRLLVLLELLQDRGHAGGEELAARLGVTRRTLRRYIAALQELGIPVEGERGVGGGYRIRPGYRLPPLMFSEDEVVAVVLGLLEAKAHQIPSASVEVVDAALAKIYRVLPSPLRRRVTALETSVLFTGSGDAEPIQGDIALRLADAVHRALQVRLRYTAYNGAQSRRRLSPFALVSHCGFWYLVAHDHDRAALRTFRVDRIRAVRVDHRVPAIVAPPDFDPVAHLQQSLASVPGAYQLSVVIDLPLELARRRLPDSIGALTPADGGSRLQARIESLDWIARVLAGLGCRVTIEHPPELRERLSDLGRSLQESAEFSLEQPPRSRGDKRSPGRSTP